MAQVVRQIPTNSQSHAPTTDESGYIDEGYLNNLTRRLGTRPSVQQFNGNNNATREINGQQQVAFLLPWLGRWLGRKFSFWAWSRFVKWYYYPRITIKAKIETTETTI
ncbi:hypothetical protein RhiirA5_358961 [Rhizophagus irregularis]|uniref:Uncharacterized protein n=1 Tax=Rhizophagus irregularis TaxID=588596 RepID=A0A2N0PLD8_9GLOM|nr:hypothetical protein RhiirA5_358961 [Rhizophagus irregularis]